MKTYIKYISLLIFSGLILPFCSGLQQADFISRLSEPPVQVLSSPDPRNLAPVHYLSIQQIMEIVAPALKK